jgi:hypothetical protein
MLAEIVSTCIMRHHSSWNCQYSCQLSWDIILAKLWVQFPRGINNSVHCKYRASSCLLLVRNNNVNTAFIIKVKLSFYPAMAAAYENRPMLCPNPEEKNALTHQLVLFEIYWIVTLVLVHPIWDCFLFVTGMWCCHIGVWRAVQSSR